jgi:hypothetical protein
VRHYTSSDGTSGPEQIGEEHTRSPIAEIRTIWPLSLASATSSVAAAQVIANLSMYGDTWVAGAAAPAAELRDWGVVTQIVQLVAIPLFMINMTIISAIPSRYRQGRMEELQ